MRYMADGEVEWVFGEMASDEATASEKGLTGNGYLVFNNGVRGYLRIMPCGTPSWEMQGIGLKLLMILKLVNRQSVQGKMGDKR